MTSTYSHKAHLTPRSLPTHQTQVRLSDDEIDAMVGDYESGQPVRQLVRTYAIHRTTVLDHLERRGVVRRQNVRKMTDDSVLRAAHMYANGVSLVNVGEAFDVNAATIRREFVAAGVGIRPRRGWADR